MRDGVGLPVLSALDHAVEYDLQLPYARVKSAFLAFAGHLHPLTESPDWPASTTPACCLIQKCYRHSVAPSILIDPATKNERLNTVVGRTSCNALADMIWGVHLSGVLRLIDTRRASRKGHYVKRPFR